MFIIASLSLNAELELLEMTFGGGRELEEVTMRSRVEGAERVPLLTWLTLTSDMTFYTDFNFFATESNFDAFFWSVELQTVACVWRR